MRSLPEIVKKNFRVLIRSKTSALIVILGPLLVIFLLGVAFDNSNLFALNIGVYSEDYNELTNEFISKLQTREYHIEKYDGQEQCVQKIKEGLLHACIIFPKGLSVDKKELNNEITFFVDHSKLNLIYVVIETLTSKINLQSEELSLNLTNILLDQLEKTRVEVFSIKPLISEMEGDAVANSNDLEQYQSDFNAVKLKFDKDLVGTTQLRSLLGVSGETNTDFVKEKLAEIRETVDAAKNAAQEEGAGQAVFILSGVKSDITSLRNNVSTIDITTAVSYVDKIESNINLASAMLEETFQFREDTRGNLEDIITKLRKAQNDIGTVNVAFNNIDSYIGSIQVNKAEDIVNPINTKIKAVTSDKTHLNFLFPSLMVLVVMFMAIILSTTLVMMEKHSPAYFRNFITPVPNIIFLLGTFLTALLIIVVQLIIIIGIAIIFFSSELLPVLSMVIPMLLLITSLFIIIGMIIGYLFNSEETGTLAAISVSSLFLLISDLIIPLETMPVSVKTIAEYNPFILGEAILKKIIIFQSSFEVYAKEFYLVLGFVVAGFILLIIIQHLMKEHFFLSIKHGYRRRKQKYLQQKVKNKKVLADKELQISTSNRKSTTKRRSRKKPRKKRRRR